MQLFRCVTNIFFYTFFKLSLMSILVFLVNLAELWGRQRSPSPEIAPPPANQLALRRREPEPLPDIQGVFIIPIVTRNMALNITLRDS